MSEEATCLLFMQLFPGPHGQMCTASTARMCLLVQCGAEDSVCIVPFHSQTGRIPFLTLSLISLNVVPKNALISLISFLGK